MKYIFHKETNKVIKSFVFSKYQEVSLKSAFPFAFSLLRKKQNFHFIALALFITCGILSLKSFLIKADFLDVKNQFLSIEQNC